MEKKKEVILIVDDDRASRRMLARALGDAGYDCREAPDGQEALQLLHAEIPSLLLLDFRMPGLNGAEVVTRLRSDPDPAIAQLPVVMLTGEGGEESEVACLEAGASDFVTKPVNVSVLRARIDTHLRLQGLRQQLQQQNAELEAWRENLERDLAAARLTQQSLIPQRPPLLPGWEVASVYRPVIQVGGDIYGWLRMADGRTLFWIVDATGHGAAAALLTTLAKLLFQHGGDRARPAEIMEAVNAEFRATFGARSFMTAMCVALDPTKGRASVVGAGHPPLLIARRDSAPEMVASGAPPLGLIENSSFVETTIDLGPGDGFLLHTDGLYGPARTGVERSTPAQLQNLLNHESTSVNHESTSAQALLERILARAVPASGEPLADDLAALLVRRVP